MLRKLNPVIMMVLLPFMAYSQDSESTGIRPSTFGVTLTMENAFGFYPVIYGSVGLSSSLDLTFYGAMWTNPSFGFPQTTFSSDLWLENSFGIGFNALGGNAYINPALGFTHGKFLSGGDESVAFEGIVPSLSLYFYPDKFESEIYFSLYQHLRDEVTDPVNRSTADFLFYWITPGYQVSNVVSLGVHYEGVFLKFGKGDFESAYHWLGPYLKLRINNKYDYRFAAGPNLKEGVYSSEWYKLTANIPLN
ncbi:MAG: hypothetical protein OEM26_09290 [Saprospiraceae bacterium]|nr:hypothetical protein [Saprospiraceae bacterium]